MLVLTVGNGTHGFTLDRDIGEFLLTHPNLLISPETREFAINASNERFWEAPVQRYVASAWRARPVFAARTSTCAGWRRWSLKFIAS
jgi:fructose-1,6-bisphosphatase